ncbi:MAG: UbiA family prenyltransferase [Acidobacteria bacterium]|nr:UbiA family prenyltransferase [Acidobacteriota bacterium]
MILELVKGRISAAAAGTAVTGYLLAGGRPSVTLGEVFLGTLLSAFGASALNQWQERAADARMPRTAARPIPSGRVSPGSALALAAALIAAGLALLARAGGLGPPVLAAAAVAVYAGLYTPLKRRTPFASVPGALTGALPPLVGWAAAGASPASAPALALGTFFFLWQVPHFIFLFRRFEAEYRQAGFPVLGDVLSGRQADRLAFVWVNAAACAALAFPLFGLVRRPAGAILLAAAALVLAGAALVSLLRGGADPRRFRRDFRWVNAFALAVCLVAAADGLGGP